MATTIGSIITSTTTEWITTGTYSGPLTATLTLVVKTSATAILSFFLYYVLTYVFDFKGFENDKSKLKETAGTQISKCAVLQIDR